MELRLPAPCLIVLVGPSGSGKSTWASNTFRPTEIVSSDRLRGMVGAGEDDQSASKAAFSILEQVVEERLARKLTTVVDTLGFDAESRRRWLGIAHRGGLPAFAIVFDTPPGKVEERNGARARPIPKAALTRQLRRFRTVRADLEADGFDQVHTCQEIAVVAPQIAGSVASRARGHDREGGHSFGLAVNRFDWGVERDEMAERLISIAHRAERAGFRDLWVMDHLRQIPQVGRAWEDLPEAYATLSFLAGATTTIRLGALVTPVTYRHPAILGKAIATLDVLSGGRANVGLGVGWDEKEHTAYGIPFPDRPARYEMLADTLEMLPILWGKGSPSFEGRHFSATELACYPRPIQERIPILVGGSGEKKTLRLVAGNADACNLFGRAEEVARKVEALHRHCSEIDRDPAEIEVSHLIRIMVATDRASLRSRVELLRGRNVAAETFESWHNAGTVDDQAAHLDAYREAGAGHSIVAMPDVHLDGSVEAFGEVIERLGGP